MVKKQRPPLPPYVPAVITRRLSWLERDTGYKPVAEKLSEKTWRIVLEGPRVRLTMDFRFRSGKRHKYTSILEIDGRSQPEAPGYWDFIRIWKRCHEPESAGFTQVEPLQALGQIADAPLEVRKLYGQISQIDANACDVSAWQEDDQWVVGVNIREKNAFMRVFYGIDKRGMWAPSDFRLVLAGVDRGDIVGKNFKDILLALAGGKNISGVPGAGPIQGGSSSAAGKANSVTVANVTVIRN